MSLYKKTEAIVLKTKPIGNTSKLITLYTKDFGKLNAVAKAARKPQSKFGGSLEPFTHIDLLLYGKENSKLDLIYQAHITYPFSLARQSLRKIGYCLYIVELVEVMISEREKDPELFYFIIEVLKLIEKRPTPLLIFAFTLKFLSHLGFRLHLSDCVICHKLPEEHMRFTPKQGGLLCRHCEADTYTVEISQETIETLKLLLESKLSEIHTVVCPNSLLVKLRSIIFENYLPYYLPGPLNSLEWIYK